LLPVLLLSLVFGALLWPLCLWVFVLPVVGAVLALELPAAGVVGLSAANAAPPTSNAEQASAEMSFIVVLLVIRIRLWGCTTQHLGAEIRPLTVTINLSRHYVFLMKSIRVDRPLCLALLLWLHLPAVAGARNVIDDDGLTVSVPQHVQRIVSLAPGATAVLFAAGAGDRLVGTAEYSDEPAAARRVARVGDSQHFDIERILALRPDVVVAWSGGTGAAQLERVAQLGLPIYRHRMAGLDDIAASVRRMGVLAGTAPIAEPAADLLAQRVRQLRARYARAPQATVLIQVWDRPIYTVGRTQLLTDALRACGYRNVFDDLSGAGPAVGIEAVLARDPDVILAVAAPALAEEWLARWRERRTLRAVTGQRLYAVTDERFSRLGPGVLDATEALCQALANSGR
jgi:iron complex transport system substrate-binding protein